MKSPITGKKMILKKEKRTVQFRRKSFNIVYHYYYCSDSHEQFTTTQLDELNTNQVYNQYRDLNHIPFPNEIVRIRKKYGLSALKMSEILGFGANSYRQYEKGEIPSVSNARLIQMLDDPKKFIEMVKLCDTLDKTLKDKYLKTGLNLIEQRKNDHFDFSEYLSGNHLADIYSGYKNPDFSKFTEMVVFFSEKTEPFKTKMNKLLFYADFLMFKQSGFSISGMRYKAIEMGPVPNNFQSVFEYLANQNEIEILYTQFPKGYIGEKFIVKGNRKFNPELFTKEELDVLNEIVKVFGKCTTKEMIDLSHKEKAWKENLNNKGTISYKYAFDLIQI